MFSGYKTYTASIGIVLVAIGGFLSGDLTLLMAVTQVLAGLGLAGLRAAK
jgi:hypothetical protein